MHLKQRPNEWFFSYELIQKQLSGGWVGTEGGRRCRELCQEGRLEKQDEGQYVKYKYKMSDLERFHLKMQNGR